MAGWYTLDRTPHPPSEIEVVVQTGPSYNVGAELSWLTAGALAYELLRLTDEIAHTPRGD